MGDLSEHFSRDEFRCRDAQGNPCPHCGGKVVVSDRLIDLLESIREQSGLPIQITSGFRCPTRNIEVGGHPHSAHLTGEAADFFVSGDLDRYRFIEALVWCEALRYGIGPDFIHADVSLTNPQSVAWRYRG